MADWSAMARQQGHRIGFVPTMGALHEGHIGLVSKALQECGQVACSIFVNPLQFNDLKDLERYPRQLEQDRDLLEKAGCHALFVPNGTALFGGLEPKIHDLGGLADRWEGSSRPGHFQGVVNVVERLFHFVRPDRAYFGEKDRQQLSVILHIAREQLWPETIVPCPTQRASDGLALSSRNALLNAEQREQATILYQALHAATRLAFTHSVAATLEVAAMILAIEPAVIPDYLGIVDPTTLEPLDSWDGHDRAVALIAARIGEVRLIDNVTLLR